MTGLSHRVPLLLVVSLFSVSCMLKPLRPYSAARASDSKSASAR